MECTWRPDKTEYETSCSSTFFLAQVLKFKPYGIAFSDAMGMEMRALCWCSVDEKESGSNSEACLHACGRERFYSHAMSDERAIM